MFQLVVIIGIVAAFVAIRRVRKQPPEKRTPMTIKYVLYGLVLLAIALVATGKVHWITAAIAGVLPLIQRMAPLVMRAMPFLEKVRSQQTQQDGPQSKQEAAFNHPPMPIDQALKVFGFEELPDKKTIVKRHRELIQKNHPDRGGSDFLAAQINEAKDTLIDEIRA